MRTVKFLTLGCKVNQYDTQSIREQFINNGFRELNNSQPASVYVINTCTVTHKADADSLNFIRRAKRESPKAKIIVTGCLTELDTDKIKQIGGVDLLVRNKDKAKLLKYFFRVSKCQSLETRGITGFKGRTRAFLKVQDGCDNFCSYCKVPLVRGRSRSRKKEEIIREAEGLVENGFQEIVLTGICLGAYGRDLGEKLNLGELITALEKIDGLLRIRLSSIEAGDISQDLISKIAASGKVCKHLHIPIQSGDDEILKKMQRRYSQADYLNLLKKIRKEIPDIAITTDILIGFPGESEENFQNTVKLLKKFAPLKTHIFPFSLRSGTQAARLANRIPPEIIKSRIAYIKNIAAQCSLSYRKRFLTKIMPVLIEGRVKFKPDYWQGHTDNYLKVMIKSRVDLKGQFMLVKLKSINNDGFLAK